MCVYRLWYFIGSATAKPVRQAYFMERLHATNAIVMSGYMVSFSSLQPQFSHQNLFEEQFLTLPLCNVNLTPPPSTQPPFSESIPHSEESPSHVLLLSAHLGKMAVSK